MAQLFPKSANVHARVTILGLVVLICGAGWATSTIYWSPYTTEVDVPLQQPIPFSHKHHVTDDGIDCRYCHTSVEKSAFAGVPPTETCMTCHSQIWTDSPLLAPVRESYLTGRPIQWARVHDLPDFVYFNHSIHIKQGVSCVSCHGRVDEMPITRKKQALSMRWCLSCHRNPEKNMRPHEHVFDLAWKPETDEDRAKVVEETEGSRVVQAGTNQYHILGRFQMTNCST